MENGAFAPEEKTWYSSINAPLLINDFFFLQGQKKYYGYKGKVSYLFLDRDIILYIAIKILNVFFIFLTFEVLKTAEL